ncbi:hypothetical protein ROZALSC1DRAFT_28117 [Rozella allomycis CSF55]|uniref:Homeodomain-like protein n=1 Tax=Rozella allomycis (strain CSF55) TaxID=988480 RepID=A0A4P9YLL7_ROZAC|nr:hypothetical protein ROZALSC1DRAFT_28117 [Rozella allomycis CSF55]
MTKKVGSLTPEKIESPAPEIVGGLDPERMINRRRHYTIKEKLYFLSILKKPKEERLVEETRALEAIPQRNLNRWRKQECRFLGVQNKNDKKTFHKGFKPIHDDISDQILELVNDFKASLKPINCTDLTKIVRDRFPLQLGDMSFEAVRSMLRRLLKRNDCKLNA